MSGRQRQMLSGWVRRTASVVVVGALLGQASCADQTKTRECNALIGAINEGVQRVQQQAVPGDAGASGVGEVRDMAETMDAVAQQTGRVALSVDELKGYAGEYGSMVKEVAEAARELASAIDKVDMEAMRKAQSRIDDAVKKEDPLVEGLNTFCRNP